MTGVGTVTGLYSKHTMLIDKRITNLTFSQAMIVTQGSFRNQVMRL